MGGIAGFTHLKGPGEAGAAERAARSLAHRGPDQRGLFQSPAVSLAAVRLRITDLCGGDQPLLSEDRDTVLIFDGRIYNSAELREQLEARGHRFLSRCDAEVVLRAFLEWDRECLARLRGMFGLAIWKESERRLVLARDRMGIKPLYYFRRAPDLYFGSELKAILAHPRVARRICRQGLAYYLSLNYVPGPYTLVEGVEKLPPGHWLEWKNGGVNCGTYWRLAFRPRAHVRVEAAREDLDSLLKAAVREHLASAVPLGVWVSGGLDSSTILHYASAVCGKPLKTFSMSFPGRSFDESRYSRVVCSAYGTEHYELDLHPGAGLAEAVEDLVNYADEPTADAGALPVWRLAGMSRPHVSVALSGEGADELFGGYVTYLADKLTRPLRLAPRALRRFALRPLRRWPASDEKIGLEYKLKRFFAGSLLDPDEAHLFWNGTFSGAEARRLFPHAEPPLLGGLYRILPPEAQPTGRINRYLWFDQLYYLPDDILVKCDRMSMAHSLEVRPPFLDHRIVEFAASLPENLKVRGLTLKRLLRELMRGKLPPEILSRRKEGFDIPAHDWFRGPLRGLLLDTLTQDAVKRSGLLRPEPVRKLIEAHLERRANVGYHLWGLLILHLWLKRWRIEAAAVEEPSSWENEATA